MSKLTLFLLLPLYLYGEAATYSFACHCDKELSLTYKNIDKTLLDDNLKKIPTPIENVSDAVDESIKTLEEEIAMVQKSNSLLTLEIVELENIRYTLDKIKNIETIK